MGRGRCDDPPSDPLVSEFRVLCSRVDRARSAARGGGPMAVAAEGVDPRLGGRNSLLLYDLLLAHLLDDPPRRCADGRRLPLTDSSFTRRRALSRACNDAGRAGDQALGYRVGTTRAGVLDHLRMGAAGCNGPTMERTRLL